MGSKLNEKNKYYKNKMFENFHKKFKFYENIDRAVVVDLETTGLDEEEGNVLEISAIEIKNGRLTGNTFHSYFEPRYKITDSATRKNQMENQFYSINCKNFYTDGKIIFENFITFVGNSPIICHFADFEKKFLRKEFVFHDLPFYKLSKFICTIDLFKSIYGNDFMANKFSRFELSNVAKYLEIKVDPRIRHTAFGDTMITGKVFIKLMEKIQLIKNKISLEEPNENSKSENISLETDYSKCLLERIREKQMERDLLRLIIKENNNSHSLLKKKKKPQSFEIKKANKTIKAKYFLFILNKEDEFTNEDYKDLKSSCDANLKPANKWLFQYSNYFIFFLGFTRNKKITEGMNYFTKKVSIIKILTQILKLE